MGEHQVNNPTNLQAEIWNFHIGRLLRKTVFPCSFVLDYCVLLKTSIMFITFIFAVVVSPRVVVHTLMFYVSIFLSSLHYH